MAAACRLVNGNRIVLISPELDRKIPPDRRAHRVEAAVVLPRGVPYEGFPIESEVGNSVTETFDGTGRRGANGRAQLVEASASIGRQRGENRFASATQSA